MKTRSLFRSIAKVIGCCLLLGVHTAQASYDYEPAPWKYDPPITLTQNMGQIDDWPAGQDIHNNPFTQWSEEVLGIRWEAKWISPDTATNVQRLNLAVASRDLPDLIAAPMNEIIKLARAGAVIPLDDLLEEYASPLTKFLMNEYREASNGTYYLPLMYEGQLYGIRQGYDLWGITNTNHWMRDDILEELGFEPPTSLAEFEEVLAAYRERYPHGVGHHIDRDLAGIETVMFAHGAAPKHWIERDGALVYGSIQPEVREGLATLQRWYRNGWIDREFITTTNLDRVIAGDVLSIQGPWWFPFWPFPDMIRNTPQARVIIAGLLEGPEGNQMITTGQGGDWAYAISATSRHPEAIILALNEVNASRFRDQEDLQQMFDIRYPYTPGALNPDKVTNQEEVDAAIAEGRRWDFVAEFDYDMPGPGFFNDRSRDFHSYFGVVFNERAYRHINQFLKFIEARQSGTLDELNTVDRIEHDQMFAGNTMLQEAHYNGILTWLAQQEQGRVRTTGFLGSPTPAMIERQPILETLENETFARIIMGDLPLEAFDSFVMQWQNQGGNAITEEVNAWYESVR